MPAHCQRNSSCSRNTAGLYYNANAAAPATTQLLPPANGLVPAAPDAVAQPGPRVQPQQPKSYEQALKRRNAVMKTLVNDLTGQGLPLEQWRPQVENMLPRLQGLMESVQAAFICNHKIARSLWETSSSSILQSSPSVTALLAELEKMCSAHPAGFQSDAKKLLDTTGRDERVLAVSYARKLQVCTGGTTCLYQRVSTLCAAWISQFPSGLSHKHQNPLDPGPV